MKIKKGEIPELTISREKAINSEGIIIKNKWFILAIVLTVLWFVWSQLRSSLIRQVCQEKARKMGNTYFGLEFLQKEEALKKSQLQEAYMEKTYDRCLHDKGLE